MGIEQEHMVSILYIGGNFDTINQLKEKAEIFRVHVVENGLSATNFLNTSSNIDAILCEHYLPGMNSFEVFKLYKKLNILHNIPFIVLAENVAADLKIEAFQMRISDFYQGKVDVQSIYNRINFLKRYSHFLINNKGDKKKSNEYRIPWDKRLFDIVVSFIALLLLSPVLIIVIILIRLESKGKVYYTSKRVGTGYKIFDFYKLRSMRVGADSSLQNLKHLNQYAVDGVIETTKEQNFCPKCAMLPQNASCSPLLYTEGKKICEYWYEETKKNKVQSTFIKIKDDPRVTKVGKFIRNTSIDELPQLLNVLKGDMSIVGNRPLPLYEAEMLTSDDWSTRFMGPAGITGLWQVEKRGKKGAMSEEERKALDNQYALNYSFWGDIKLILRTIPAVFQKENV